MNTADELHPSGRRIPTLGNGVSYDDDTYATMIGESKRAEIEAGERCVACELESVHGDPHVELIRCGCGRATCWDCWDANDRQCGSPQCDRLARGG